MKKKAAPDDSRLMEHPTMAEAVAMLAKEAEIVEITSPDPAPTATVTDIRRSLGHYLKQAQHRPVLITSNGIGVAALVAVDSRGRVDVAEEFLR